MNYSRLATIIRKLQVPALYAQSEAAEPIIYFSFRPFGIDWTWHVFEAEIQKNDILFFGLVCGHEEELGYFRLSELLELQYLLITSPLIPMKFSEAKEKYKFKYQLSAEAD